MKPILAIAFVLITSISMADDIEEPRWQLIDTLDGVEVRQYAPSLQATTELGGSADSSAGFRRLAGFIFGGNDRNQEIAMTAPVSESLRDARPIMAFTMPSAYAKQDLPIPDDASITITEVPERKLAAIRFSGWATQGKIDKKSQELLAVLQRHGVKTIGGTSLNQYNPPWTPPFMRRNEIVIEVVGSTGLAASR